LVLRRVEEAWIVGAAVSELSHILAELVENGLAFSPPDLDVEIYGGRVAGGYLLAVVDHGIGMSKEQLATANARLRGDEDFIVAPTRFLGHYVVGRLAQRLGIEIELTVSPVSGIAARLLLPFDLAVDPQAPLPTPEPELMPPLTPDAGLRTTLFATPHEIAWPTDELTRDSQPSTAIATASAFTSTLPSPTTIAAAVTTAAAASDAGLPDVEPHGVEPPEGGEATRTRNGLVKRVKRAPGPAPARPPAGPQAGPTSNPLIDRSPDEVRGMLSSFRSGHQRGSSTDDAGLVPTTQKDNR
jgi:hypothetical protein